MYIGFGLAIFFFGNSCKTKAKYDFLCKWQFKYKKSISDLNWGLDISILLIKVTGWERSQNSTLPALENGFRHDLAVMESSGAYSTWGKPIWNTAQLCTHTLQANKRHTGSLQGCVVQRCILIQRVLGLHTAQHTDWEKICFGSNSAGLLCLFSQLLNTYFYVICFLFTSFKCVWFSDGTSLMILLQLLWKYALKAAACRQVMALKIFSLSLLLF